MKTQNDPAAEPMVARDATYYRAPEGLRERVREALPQLAGGRLSALWSAAGLSAAFAMVALVSWTAAMFYARPAPEELLLRDVLGAHLRSLMGEGHLNDVASSDRHTVKPWFAGKLDFAPPVEDLAAAGFALTGGRLDYVNGRAVAALTYRYRQHMVNVFVWPAEAGASDEGPRAIARQGYSLVHWRAGAMQYWAIADVSAAQLLTLAELLRRPS
ncbi:MAG TPA: hypothetical protein VN878_01090 [Usitatibacter sp.]|nr:hypothetical protein [Usitatibacter sp.]